MCAGNARWIKSVAGAAVEWIRWPNKVQGVMGSGAKACIAELRWCWGVEAEGFIDEIDLERPLIRGSVKGWSRWD